MTTACKKNLVVGKAFLYNAAVAKKVFVTEKDLAKIAKEYRSASGKSRNQAARELGVTHVSIIHAEDQPKKSFFKLRKRIIEKYSPYKVVGPAFWLERK